MTLTECLEAWRLEPMDMGIWECEREYSGGGLQSFWLERLGGWQAMPLVEVGPTGGGAVLVVGEEG